MVSFATSLYHMLQMENFPEKYQSIAPCNDACQFCFLDYADTLGENSLFKRLQPYEIGVIIRNSQHKVRNFAKGDIVASQGDTLHSLMIIVHGSVVGEMMDYDGRILRVEHIKAPNTVATVFLFGENNRLPVSVVAQEDTRVLMISRQGLLDLFSKNPVVLQNFLDIMANRAQFLSRQMKILGLSSIKGKIAHFLMEQIKKHNSLEFKLPITQNELAEMFGVTRPSLGRTLREMNDEGFIQTKGKEVKILNKGKLAQLVR